MLLNYDAWNWLIFSQNDIKWYSDNFQEHSKAYTAKSGEHMGR